ncbi:MAG: AAA family ATPase [Armatimonas sp.]
MSSPPVSIILLNGASSSGKTTLGRALQAQLKTPYFYFSSDQLVEAQVLPRLDRTVQEGDWAWRTIRPRFFDGFHQCIAALANAGNPLIVEHVFEYQAWLEDCIRLLANFDVFYVGVHCPLEELERRERERGNRTPGEGRSHLEDGVHTWCEYDFEVDTSVNTPAENARLIEQALKNTPRPFVFRRRYVSQPNM